MYREKEEQKEMLRVCGKLINAIYEAYAKKELNELDFISKCSFVCGLSMQPLAIAKNMNLWKLH